MNRIKEEILKLLEKRDMTSTEIRRELERRGFCDKKKGFTQKINSYLLELRIKGLIEVVGEKSGAYLYSLTYKRHFFP